MFFSLFLSFHLSLVSFTHSGKSLSFIYLFILDTEEGRLLRSSKACSSFFHHLDLFNFFLHNLLCFRLRFTVFVSSDQQHYVRIQTHMVKTTREELEMHVKFFLTCSMQKCFLPWGSNHYFTCSELKSFVSTDDTKRMSKAAKQQWQHENKK